MGPLRGKDSSHQRISLTLLPQMTTETTVYKMKRDKQESNRLHIILHPFQISICTQMYRWDKGESLVQSCMQPPEVTNPGPGQGTGRVAGPVLHATSRGHESWTRTGNRESRWSNLQRTRILDHNREQGESLMLVQSQVMFHFEMSYVQKTSLIQTAKKVSSLEGCHHFCKSGTWGEERCPVQRGVLI